MAKKKINDDTPLQLIRDGNSPAGAARRLGVGRCVFDNPVPHTPSQSTGKPLLSATANPPE
ncbi:MAG: hypothetical protein WAN11_08090 [Syntrophobacteraceae bacterium]